MNLYRLHYYNFGTEVFTWDGSQTSVLIGWRGLGGLEGRWVSAINNNYFSQGTLTEEEVLFKFGEEL